jgi:hypothetical protein
LKPKSSLKVDKDKNKKETIHTYKRSDSKNKSRQSVNQQAKKKFKNLTTLFHVKRGSSTPDNRMASSTFEGKEQDVKYSQSGMIMVVKKIEKSEYINPPKVETYKQIQKETQQDDLISDDHELDITYQSKLAFSKYEKFLVSKRVEGKRAQTAHKPKRVENRFDSGSFITKQYNDTLSPAN